MIKLFSTCIREGLLVWLLGNFAHTLFHRVTESRNKDFPVGTYLLARFGWRTLTVVNPSSPPEGTTILRVPDMGTLPKSLALGTLGMPGYVLDYVAHNLKTSGEAYSMPVI